MPPSSSYRVVLRPSGGKVLTTTRKTAYLYSNKLIHVRSRNIYVRGPIDSRAWI